MKPLQRLSSMLVSQSLVNDKTSRAHTPHGPNRFGFLLMAKNGKRGGWKHSCASNKKRPPSLKHLPATCLRWHQKRSGNKKNNTTTPHTQESHITRRIQNPPPPTRWKMLLPFSTSYFLYFVFMAQSAITFHEISFFVLSKQYMYAILFQQLFALCPVAGKRDRQLSSFRATAFFWQSPDCIIEFNFDCVSMLLSLCVYSNPFFLSTFNYQKIPHHHQLFSFFLPFFIYFLFWNDIQSTSPTLAKWRESNKKWKKTGGWNLK